MYFFFQAEDGIRDLTVTGVQTCALPIYLGFSITGGYVYRGLQTTQVAGNYVFGDFGGMIAWLAPDGAGGFDVQELVEQSCTPPGAPGALQISSFAQDVDGELFVLDYDSGQILQLAFTE